MLRSIASYELGRDRKKDFRLFKLAFFLFLCYGIAFQLLVYSWYRANGYVTTLFALSYLKNGFVRRGLVGTLFDMVCHIVPSARSYQGAIWFMWGMNLVYFASLLSFVRWVLEKVKDSALYKGIYFFSLICFAFMIPTVCTHLGALGRPDILQIVICILSVRLLLEKKHIWLTVPLTAINVLLHEGYALMTFCAVVIVIIYQAFNSEKERAKYWLLLIANGAVCALLTSYFLFAGSAGTAETFVQTADTARALNLRGEYDVNLLIMANGVAPENIEAYDDALYVASNLKELPVFLVCFIPAFFVFLKGIFGLFRHSGGEKKWTHLAAALLGPMLIGVQYGVHCDYGRYLFWLVFYFFTVFLSFSVLGDRGAENTLRKVYGYANVKALIIIALMIPYQPLPTCSFTMISKFLTLRLLP